MLEQTNEMDLLDCLEVQALNRREIYICDDIEEYLAGRFAKFMDFLLADNYGPIKIYITTQGGSVTAAYSIINTIKKAQERGAHTTGIVRGYAMSSGAMILQACSKRVMGEHDLLMLHGAFSLVSGGDLEDKDADREMTKKYMTLFRDLCVERNTSEISEYHNPEYWDEVFASKTQNYFFGDAAFEAGLVDDLTYYI